MPGARTIVLLETGKSVKQENLREISKRGRSVFPGCRYIMPMLHSVDILARVTSVSYHIVGKTWEEGPPPKHCKKLQLPVFSMSHLQSLSTQLLWTLRAGLTPPAAGANLTDGPP